MDFIKSYSFRTRIVNFLCDENGKYEQSISDEYQSTIESPESTLSVFKLQAELAIFFMKHF